MKCLHTNRIWLDTTYWLCEDCEKKGNVNCRSGCPTQDHASYGDCLQGANIGIDKTSLRP